MDITTGDHLAAPSKQPHRIESTKSAGKRDQVECNSPPAKRQCRREITPLPEKVANDSVISTPILLPPAPSVPTAKCNNLSDAARDRSPPYVCRTTFVNDAMAERELHKAETRLYRRGLYKDHEGKAVRFDDLEPFVQMGLLTTVSRPIKDKVTFAKGMLRDVPIRVDGDGGEESDSHVWKSNREGAGTAMAMDGSTPVSGHPALTNNAQQLYEDSSAVDKQSLFDQFIHQDDIAQIDDESTHITAPTPPGPNRSLVPITGASAFPTPNTSAHEEQSTSHPAIWHDGVGYTEKTCTMLRRKQPSIEKSWHPSKCKERSLSGTMYAELKEKGKAAGNGRMSFEAYGAHL